MRIIVGVVVRGEERAVAAQELDDLLVHVEHVFARPLRHAAFFGEFTVVVHGRKDRETVLHARDVVVLTVTGGDVHLAGSGFHGDEIGCDDARRRGRKGAARRGRRAPGLS